VLSLAAGQARGERPRPGARGLRLGDAAVDLMRARESDRGQREPGVGGEGVLEDAIGARHREEDAVHARAVGVHCARRGGGQREAVAVFIHFAPSS